MQDKIVALWNENKTGTEIAEALGLTRNAVLGMIFRLRTKGMINVRQKDQDAVRKDPDKLYRRKVKGAKKPKQPKKPKVERRGAPKPFPVLRGGEKTDLPQPVTPQKAVQLDGLRLGSCRYIVSGSGPSAFYCGDPKERGSYCAGHAAICYIDPKAYRSQNRQNRRKRLKAA